MTLGDDPVGLGGLGQGVDLLDVRVAQGSLLEHAGQQAELLARKMREKEIELLHIALRPVDVEEFNGLIADTDNKSRAHFQAYGTSSLDFEIVYYVLAPDYNLYMDIQQAINLRIHERFEQEGIAFAYPTQTVYVHRVDGEQEG